MDHDQEVVREPFDDGDSVFSAEHSDEEANHRGAESRGRRNFHCSADRTSLDRCEQVYPRSENGDDSEDEADDPSSQEEDANFAKKYGIKLKTKVTKGELAYKKLLKSGQLDVTQNKSQNGEPNKLRTSVTSDCIYHKGTFYQKGDIVALRDQDDDQAYFAQLTGFLQDQYCEKSASLTWLVPTRTTSREFFDPSAYRIGLEDPQLRKLDCVTFIRHCPHDYYLRKLFQAEASSSTTDQSSSAGQPLLKSRSSKDKYYIWTTMEPCLVPPIVTD